jgi:glycolate oxidase FAD binding subunit
MAGRRIPMSDKVLAKVRAALGTDAVDQDVMGRPRVAPDSTAGVARALGLANEQEWQVCIEGRGSWTPPDVPADLVVSTAALDRLITIAPGDLMATVQAGAALSTVNQRLVEGGVWLAWDPPGQPQRSVGSIVATGTAGPLRHRFGPIRDHLLGCTLVTGDGRVVKPGGKVVKNVAGYDLTRLMAGGFGAFGIITELHLRLRAIPAADCTFVAVAPRDVLSAAARDLVEAGIEASAMELFSPALAAEADWALALRLAGIEEGVTDEAQRAQALTEFIWRELSPSRASALWNGAAQAALTGSVTIRLGVLPEGIDDTIDLLEEHADAGLVSAGAGSGAIRWTGDTTLDRLQAIRRAAAGREIPLTLERAPWPLCRAFGHFGAYREGVGNLVARLRDTFDPGHVLQVPLDA